MADAEAGGGLAPLAYGGVPSHGKGGNVQVRLPFPGRGPQNRRLYHNIRGGTGLSAAPLLDGTLLWRSLVSTQLQERPFQAERSTIDRILWLCSFSLCLQA